MADNSEFRSNVDSLFKGLDNFLTTKTVIGEATQVGDAMMIPLAEVSFGLGAGAFAGGSRNNGGGGMGAKVSPAAVLMVSKDGTTKLISLKSQDAVGKIIDMAPDIITKIQQKLGGGAEEEPAAEE